MLQLTYHSTAKHPPKSPQDLDILNEALHFNSQHGICGYLVRSGQSFVQVLEGHEIVVQDLYSRICRDPRHHSVQLLATRDVSQPEFCDWSMGYSESVPQDDDDSLRRLISQCPYNSNAMEIISLIRDIAIREFAKIQLYPSSAAAISA